MELKTVLKHVAVQICVLPEEKMKQTICKVTQDSREVVPDSLFIAIKGANFDGHDMLEEVIAKGATAVVVEKEPNRKGIPYILVKDTKKAVAQIANAFYKSPSQKLNVIGVTGTNGKTTITHLIDQLISNIGQKTAVIGTMYNKVADKIIPTQNTTPDSLTLQKLFQQMLEAQVELCAMEVSSHGLIQGRTWGVDIDVAVFSNFSQDHLDFHETMEEYFNAKALLFSQLGNSYHDKNKCAVLNYDDAHAQKLINYTAHNVLTYGCSEKADLQASNIQVTSSGTRFTLAYQQQNYKIETQLIGDFNIYNILAALGACLASGYELTDLVAGIPNLQPVKGRFQLVDNCKKAVAIVDYAHTPDGLVNILETAKKLATQKIYCVVGCGGDRDKTKRPIMADIALEYSDYVLFTSDNPRTEEPAQILADMCGHLKGNNFEQVVDRKEAIERALLLAQADDLLVVAGKGHEDYQIIGKQKHYFDDSEVIKNYAMKESL